jgi:hypothetical protein
MQTHFILDSSELDYSLIDKLKVLFKNKRIELIISESDDTSYLLSSPKNKEILLNSIKNIENHTNCTIPCNERYSIPKRESNL